MTLSAQAVNFILHMGSTMLLARLLSPADFGLVGMVTAITAFFALFKDAGLSAATVQREKITPQQISTLFWINVGLSLILMLGVAGIAPLIAGLYEEPRLVWITVALSIGFLASGFTIQHRALLRRQMRFSTLAIADTASMGVGIAVGAFMAFSGFGYWALVGMNIATGVASMAATWIAMPWRPGLPKRGYGVRSMLKFGGNIAGFNFVNYFARNADNVLIGWYWGASALGLYQKAYNLLLLPIQQVNAPVLNIAMPALSRLQSEPERFRRYFIGGYSVVASFTLPISCGMFVYAEDLVRFLLGPQWSGAVPIFRFLAPAAVVGALLNPLGCLSVATGQPHRQLNRACVGAVLIVLAFAVGLPFGPEGVAKAYSIIISVLAVPLCIHATRGTPVRFRDIAAAIHRPALAAMLASALGFAVKTQSLNLPAGVRALGGCALIAVIYGFVLLVVMGEWRVYRSYLSQSWPARLSSQPD